jgi:hypothetical protein
MAPHRGGSGCDDARNRTGRRENRKPAPVAQCRRDAEKHEHHDDEPPCAGRGEQRHQTEAARERSRDRACRVHAYAAPICRPTSSRPRPRSAIAAELHAGDHGGWKRDNRGDDHPRRHVAIEAQRAETAECVRK